MNQSNTPMTYDEYKAWEQMMQAQGRMLTPEQVMARQLQEQQRAGGVSGQQGTPVGSGQEAGLLSRVQGGLGAGLDFMRYGLRDGLRDLGQNFMQRHRGDYQQAFDRRNDPMYRDNQQIER